MMRLFLPQAQLEEWALEDKADVKDGVLVVTGEEGVYPVTPAVHIVQLVTGEDSNSLVTKVKTEAQLQALGARLLDASGMELARGGAALRSLSSLEISGLRERMAGVRVLVASDVDNPLLGRHGAAAVYGPQKGATPDDVARLDAALHRWAALARAATGVDAAGRPGAGAAGGVGFAAMVFLGAEVRSGIDYLLPAMYEAALKEFPKASPTPRVVTTQISKDTAKP